MELSEKSRTILDYLAKGHSYEQVLVQELAWTYQDIFDAVAEALALIQSARHGPAAATHASSAPPARENSDYEARMQAIRAEHPRAYDKWTDEEDERLRAAHRSGKQLKELALLFQRQPGAIRSRLEKLNPT